MTLDDYKKFWQGFDMNQDVFTNDRTKNKTTSQMEEMCFCFMVVVKLRELKYLDQHNRPNMNIQLDARCHCHLEQEWPRTISIKDRVFQSTFF